MCVPLVIYTARSLVRQRELCVDVARAPCVCRVCAATRRRPKVYFASALPEFGLAGTSRPVGRCR